MSRIFVLGSINTDFSIYCDRMPVKGETVVGRNFLISSGGKGANQAVAGAKLGGNVVMLGAVGTDIFADKLVKTLYDYGADTSYILKKNATTGVAVITIENSDNRIILDGGANDLVKESDFTQILAENAKKGDIFLSQMEIPIETVRISLKTAKKLGMTTVLNPAPAKKIDKSIYEYCDYLIPNEIEASVLSGFNVTDNNLENVCSFFIKLGVNNVIITLGENGCIYHNGKDTQKVSAVCVKAVDTTAAGDTFVGAFAAALSEGKSDIEALKFAVRASALAVTKYGAQQSIPTRSELNNFKGNY